MQTLWNKGISASDAVENFTVGNDRILDLRLAEYDVMGSKAHIAMLAEVGLLAKDEEEILQKELDNILKTIKEGSFVLEECAEDIHSQVELLLTRKLRLTEKIHLPCYVVSQLMLYAVDKQGAYLNESLARDSEAVEGSGFDHDIEAFGVHGT